MSIFQRILGSATKAIGDRTGGTAAGQTDWREMVRTAADRLTGDDRASDDRPARQASAASQRGPRAGGGEAVDADRAAIARYDYLLKTAPPERLEEIHREAFERLTPEQRAQVLQRLSADAAPGEAPASDEPADLARSATRQESARPGSMKRLLGAGAVGAGVAGVGGLALAVAGGAAASAVAGPLLAGAPDIGELVGGLTGGVEDLAANGSEQLGALGEQAQGFGEQVQGFGEQAQGFGIEDLFGS